jgi:hypothetical protein
MEKRIERLQKERVLRRLRRLLGPLGFARTRPTFFTRHREFVIEFVHVHKFTFKPGFRIHVGLRVTNDTFEACSLNGPDSEGAPPRFEFGASEQSVAQCAAEMLQYVEDVAEPWFGRWRGLDRLLHDSSSPLDPGAKTCLREAVNSKVSPERVAHTKRLLGVAQPADAADGTRAAADRHHR